MHLQSEGPVVIKVVDGEAAEPAWLWQRTGSLLRPPSSPARELPVAPGTRPLPG